MRSLAKNTLKYEKHEKTCATKNLNFEKKRWNLYLQCWHLKHSRYGDSDFVHVGERFQKSPFLVTSVPLTGIAITENGPTHGPYPYTSRETKLQSTYTREVVHTQSSLISKERHEEETGLRCWLSLRDRRSTWCSGPPKAPGKTQGPEQEALRENLFQG